MNYLFWRSLLQMCGVQNYSRLKVPCKITPTGIHLLGVVPARIHRLECLAKLLLPKSALVGPYVPTILMYSNGTGLPGLSSLPRSTMAQQ